MLLPTTAPLLMVGENNDNFVREGSFESDAHLSSTGRAAYEGLKLAKSSVRLGHDIVFHQLLDSVDKFGERNLVYNKL